MQPQLYAVTPNLGYSNLAAASRWNTTRPLRLAAVQVPPFQQLPSSISRVANVGVAAPAVNQVCSILTQTEQVHGSADLARVVTL